MHLTNNSPAFVDSQLASGTRICVLEDDIRTAQMLIFTLGTNGCTVDAFSTIEEIKQALKSSIFDLLILDWTVADGEASEVLHYVRVERHSTVPILIQSGHSDSKFILEGLDLGADDYVCKPYDLNVLRARVGALLRRSRQSKALGGIRDVPPWKFDANNSLVYYEDKKIDLAHLEARLAVMFLSSLGQLLRREEIIKTLWGAEDELPNPRMVDRLVSDLRAKVFRPELSDMHIVSARGLGYRLARAGSDRDEY